VKMRPMIKLREKPKRADDAMDLTTFRGSKMEVASGVGCDMVFFFADPIYASRTATKRIIFSVCENCGNILKQDKKADHRSSQMKFKTKADRK
jgi:hypothetical protein